MRFDHAAARFLGIVCGLLLLQALAQAAIPNRDATPAYAEEQTIQQTEQGTPAPGLWSPASGRHDFDRHYIIPPGNPQISDTTESDVILQRGGNTWRSWRNGPIAAISGTLLIVVPILIWGLYVTVGPSRLERPETGHPVGRFSSWERTIHWATAISFLLLALTGLIILFGKKLLLPWMGHFPYAWLAIIAKYIHNFIGPLFILCSIILFVTFVRDNFWRRYDWTWLRRIGRGHAPAGRFNAGEKLWFWLGVFFLGLVMSVTGIILDFVDLGQSRYILQIANYFHLAGATLYIAAAMGHIYIGTLGTPGAYHAMRYGTVDEEWAREHHDLWYDEVKNAPPAPPDGPAAPARPQT
jgi:formate dehydrogenase subunit gamma